MKLGKAVARASSGAEGGARLVDLLRRQLRDVTHGGRNYVAEVVENDDGTFDLIGVEILATGGPIHGVGSPPEGDFWRLEELRSMAEAAAELADELDAPAKIGHPDEQTMVENSIKAGELPTPQDGEMPAVGWVENQRLDGERLLGDVRKVPKIVKQLIELGAYRTRSVELSKVTSQKTGKTYDWVVTGLAWLGGKMPAVRTLGDVVALYAGDIPVRRVFVDNREYAPGDVVWNPRRSLGALRADLQEALNGPGYPTVDPRWYVRDVSIDHTAIVEDWAAISPDEYDAYVVSFTIDDAGTVVPSPFGDWVKAEQTWVETAKEYEAVTIRERRSDTGATMRYSQEQIRKFAAATGLKADAVTEKMLEDAGVTPVEDPAPDPAPDPTPDPAPDPTPDPAPAPTDDEPDRELTQRVKSLEEQNRALQLENKAERRRVFVDKAIKDAKIAPGQRGTLESLFDKGEDEARKFVDELKPREDLLLELGAEDDEDGDERDLEERNRDYAENATGRLGIDAKDLV